MPQSDVEISGPLFAQNRRSIVRRTLEQSQVEVGEFLVNRVRAKLDDVLVNPTGFYKSRIAFTTMQESTFVNDQGVVYGAWLEGTSSRNQRSRFKGYSAFRRTLEETDTKVPDIVEADISHMVKELS